jgi:hypothetical protein
VNFITDAIRALSPDAQLVLMLSIFTMVLLIGTSRSAKQNFCDFFKTLLLFRKRKP